MEPGVLEVVLLDEEVDELDVELVVGCAVVVVGWVVVVVGCDVVGVGCVVVVVGCVAVGRVVVVDV